MLFWSVRYIDLTETSPDIINLPNIIFILQRNYRQLTLKDSLCQLRVATTSSRSIEPIIRFHLHTKQHHWPIHSFYTSTSNSTRNTYRIPLSTTPLYEFNSTSSDPRCCSAHVVDLLSTFISSCFYRTHYLPRIQGLTIHLLAVRSGVLSTR